MSGFIFHFLSRRKKKIGKLTMTPDIIVIELMDNILTFNIQDITGFRIRRCYSEIKKVNVSLMSSYDNWISYKHDSSNYKFQFMIESGYSNNQLNDLVNSWKERNDFIFVED
jgi:hypothetical protein